MFSITFASNKRVFCSAVELTAKLELSGRPELGYSARTTQLGFKLVVLVLDPQELFSDLSHVLQQM